MNLPPVRRHLLMFPGPPYSEHEPPVGETSYSNLMLVEKMSVLLIDLSWLYSSWISNTFG